MASRIDTYFQKNSDQLVADVRACRAPFYTEHFDKSKEAIAGALEGLENTALILGTGRCHDLPLETLAGRFTRVVLVDIDLRHTRAAIERLPETERRKFHLREADLSGYLKQLDEKIEEFFEQGLSCNEFISQVLEVLPELKRKALQVEGEKPSFVCSSLLSSQLVGEMVNYLDSCCTGYYGQSFSIPLSRKEAFEGWLQKVQNEHLSELAALVHERGKIYFADHFSIKEMVHYTAEFGEGDMESEESLLPTAPGLIAFIEKNFSIASKDRWTWTLPIHSSTGKIKVQERHAVRVYPADFQQRRGYQISSHVLTPKSTKSE